MVLGAIGKGYAALRARVVMGEMGIKNGLVNASGDLLCWGKPMEKDLWEIKIPDPENADYVLAALNIPNGSVVTSGGYEKYALIDGKRYSHIIDPRTGVPVVGLKKCKYRLPKSRIGRCFSHNGNCFRRRSGFKFNQSTKRHRMFICES